MLFVEYLRGQSNTDANRNVIDYVTIATLGNAQDFGDLTGSRNYSMGGASWHQVCNSICG